MRCRYHEGADSMKLETGESRLSGHGVDARVAGRGQEGEGQHPFRVADKDRPTRLRFDTDAPPGRALLPLSASLEKACYLQCHHVSLFTPSIVTSRCSPSAQHYSTTWPCARQLAEGA